MRRTRLLTFCMMTLVGLAFGMGAGCQEDDTGALRTIIGDGLTPTSPLNPCALAEDEERLTADLLLRINRERQRRGLSPVKRNETLDRIAAFYACRMIDGGFFSHVDPDDASRIDSRAGDFGYAFQKLGENLAAGQESVEQVMREWMRSPGHRANILDPDFTEVGLSLRLGGERGIYWVQEFGKPLTSKSVETPEDDADELTEMKDVSPSTQPAAQADGLDDFSVQLESPLIPESWRILASMMGAV